MTASMNSPATKSDGRKIDTWEITLPDQDTYAVTVSMISRNDKTSFVATCKEGLLSDLTLRSDDINELRRLVRERAEQVAEDYLAADWTKALQVTTKRSWSRAGEDTSFTIDVAWHPLRVDRSTPPSNIGEHRVLINGHQTVAIQRDHRDRFPDSNDMSISKRAFNRRDEGNAISILDATPEALTALDEMKELFLLFNERLLDRMSPGPMSRDGVPSREEILKLMQEANTAFEAGDRGQKPLADEILI